MKITIMIIRSCSATGTIC